MENPDKILKWSYRLASEWAQEYLVPKSVNSSRKFDAYKKNEKYLPLHYPRRPDDYFRYRGTWKGWSDFFGFPEHKPVKRFVDYSTASRVARENGIRNSREYKEWEDKPYNLPKRPDQYYKEHWQGWDKFLGTNYYVPRTRNAKLNEEDVKIIKHQLGMGVPGAALARYFNVSEMQISRIKKGENWGNI